MMEIRGNGAAGRLGLQWAASKQLKSLCYFPDTIFEKAEVTKNGVMGNENKIFVLQCSCFFLFGKALPR
jgi:hypothetical protein